MSFQFHALAPAPFKHLFSLSDTELRAHKAVRRKATSCPGAPCRISLEDAPIGEELILVQYRHLPVNSPYASSHAIYVRENVKQAKPAKNEVPHLIQSRLISIRAFSADHMMINADVIEGAQTAESISQMFDNAHTDYLHVHYAKPGCFAARVTRG